MGKVGAILGPALVEGGHELVATEAEADAMLDFTAPGVVVANIRRALDAGVPCVVGTSGWEVAEVEEAAKASELPVFYAPNFALGAVLMMRFAREASHHFPAAQIIELHHETKVDAPSGTAIATAAGMQGLVPIHSVRLPGLVAHQEVILGGRGETLTIRHDTTSRDAFVPGVELALAKLSTLPPGVTVGLDSLL
jgi:4-hydroxy-tetrahydrodipicolinate reductase